MLKALIGKQIAEVFQTYFIDRKTGKARSRGNLIKTLLLAVIIFAGVGMSFFSISEGLAEGILGFDVNWLYFAMMALLAMALGLFGSVFSTYESLYLPKDNAMLLSMPIPPVKLLISRMAGVYAASLLYCAWMWIPASIAYWMHVRLSPGGIIGPVLTLFVLALFVTVLSCILGFAVAFIVTKTKGKSFLTVVLTLIGIAIYYFVYTKVLSSMRSILDNLDGISSTMRSKLYYMYLLGRASDGDALSFVITALITLALAVLCVLVMSRTFTGLALSESRAERKKLTAKGFEATPLKKAVLFRELTHFTATPPWMLNSGFGIILMPVMTVIAIIKRDMITSAINDIQPSAPELVAAVPILLFAVISAVTATDSITSASISLEGRSLWIVQSLPIEPRDILRAKENLHIYLNAVPAIIMVVTLGFILGLDPIELMLVTCASFMFITVSAETGLILDLLHPALFWTNVAAPVKQNISVMISSFGGWLVVAALTIGGYYLSLVAGTRITLVVIVVILAVARRFTTMWLDRKGAEVFSTL